MGDLSSPRLSELTKEIESNRRLVGLFRRRDEALAAQGIAVADQESYLAAMFRQRASWQAVVGSIAGNRCEL